MEESEQTSLKWAAIQSLPTVARLRRGLLTTPNGESNEIDVHNIGLQERTYLLQRLVTHDVDTDDSFLLKLMRDRYDRAGVGIPTIEVRFQDLNVQAQVQLGKRAFPTITNYMLDMLEAPLKYVLKRRKQDLNILQDVSGIIKHSRMTLLLGPPSSGKTTLLLALAGKLDPNLKFTGKVTYNGHEMNEFVPQRTAVYVDQNDVHFGELTVRETLAFSARVQGVGPRYDILEEVCRKEEEENIIPDPDIDVYMKTVATEDQRANVITDYILKILGLDNCGDSMLRGISKEQRKQVTIGEMLVGPIKAYFMDEISNGLDDSTTFQIVKSLKQFVCLLKRTAMISLQQPSLETYNLFDDIILLSDGHIVYHGPCEQVLDFFSSMGFLCPERKSVIDFLQEVTSVKDQEQYWVQNEKPYRFVTAEEFAEAFETSHNGRRLGNELATQFDKSKSHPGALTSNKYGIAKRELFKICLSREYLLIKRNSFYYILKLLQIALVAVITMTVFLPTQMHHDSVSDGGIYAGALFYGSLVILLNGFAELSMMVGRLPVFYKQRDLLFFPSWAYALPSWILKVPINFAEVGIWVFFTYSVIGDPNVIGRTFLLLVLASQMANVFCRLVAAIGREMSMAGTLGLFSLAMLVVVVSKDNIKKWWLCEFWISPTMYGQNALLSNEFHGKTWRHVLPNSTEPLGVQVLKSRGFFTQSYWYWIGFGALIGYTLLFIIGNILALTFLNPLKEHQVVKSIWSLSRTKQSVMDSEHNRKSVMILPFEPHCITFVDLTYSVNMPQSQEKINQGVTGDRLNLLKDVNGAFRPGVLTALMCVNGAGKTTLMDVLTGRKTKGYISGNITISGYPKKQDSFTRICGYCDQNDIHSPYVTVYESLLFSAWLRLSAEINDETRKMFIEEVMELVELTTLKDAIVGLPGANGLSTQQRKRLTIAVELLANPSIIFMDDPTSGLDATSVSIVMRVIRTLVDNRRTIVCAIHQPKVDIFEYFDELFLMKQGGQVIYAGPIGHHSSHLISYFEGIQGVSKIKDGCNSATWMLEVTSSVKEMELGIDFAEVYKNSELHRRNKALIAELSVPAPDSEDLLFPSKYSRPLFTQCKACLWKQHWSYWRNPRYNGLRFLFTVAASIFFGCMFYGIGSKIEKRQDLSNTIGSMLITVLLVGIKNANSVQGVVGIERRVFYKENSAGMYSSLAYSIAQALIEIPYVLIQTLIYGTIVYTMVGFEWSVTKFFWYIYFMFFTSLYFTYYGMMSLAITPNQNATTFLTRLSYVLWNLFSGFVVSPPKIPIWWRWFYWTNPIAWSLNGLVTSQFGDIKDHIEFNGTSVSVQDFLESYYGFKHDFLGVVAAVVVGFTLAFVLVFVMSIRMFNFPL
ncbi:pleiotropic drug resistance protein 1-like isoform X1 [Vicia villosa]|uniref:pleiotropic drug resistance protein 1-like isoform X1 n=1 Tax=Vicia villosa TaxID=3911 RepID=UPI00273AB946|nr:pleiotropic drug resistance protein 1-like isoform X1 [Vicia villosa]